MPKMKPHSGAKKRFKVTGSGKLMRRKANKGHLMIQKNSKRVRTLAAPAEVSADDARRVKKLLGK